MVNWRAEGRDPHSPGGTGLPPVSEVQEGHVHHRVKWEVGLTPCLPHGTWRWETLARRKDCEPKAPSPEDWLWTLLEVEGWGQLAISPWVRGHRQ